MVDPYTGAILGIRPGGMDFLAYVHQLHLRLLIRNKADTGKTIVSWAGMAMLFLLGSLGLGIFISAAVKSQLLATQTAMLATYLPSVLLSGLIFDLRSLRGQEVQRVGRARRRRTRRTDHHYDQHHLAGPGGHGGAADV